MTLIALLNSGASHDAYGHCMAVGIGEGDLVAVGVVRIIICVRHTGNAECIYHGQLAARRVVFEGFSFFLALRVTSIALSLRKKRTLRQQAKEPEQILSRIPAHYG
jgi:hypothetical protein